MTVAGIMSGTSADGIDIAIVRIRPRGNDLDLKLLGHASFPFSPALRRAVLGSMDADAISTAALARLHWRLGQAYAEALKETRRTIPCRLDLIGCHGQTIYHQAKAKPFAGREVACTWQIGEMALLATGAGLPVVSNFRSADMAVGGEGAPLVPLLDYVLYRHATKGRVLQNIGGIGNLTILPPTPDRSSLLAFDTGPGNMIIDQLAQRLFGKKYDRDGKIAAGGKVLDAVVATLLRESFFHLAPPKTAGREQFGHGYALRLEKACARAGASPADTIATATALTAESIQLAYAAFGRARMVNCPIEFIVSGGGARNQTLMRMLSSMLEPMGCRVMTSDRLGMPAEAKEAAAFALLAYQTWHRRAGNLPAATGASRPAILGEIHYA
jgi:anhydro-N-acetylmuramic acid kinase